MLRGSKCSKITFVGGVEYVKDNGPGNHHDYSGRNMHYYPALLCSTLVYVGVCGGPL